MIIENEKGQAEVLGCILAPILVFGWLFLVIACIVLMVRGIRLQNELEAAARLYWRQIPLEDEGLILNVAFPSKVVPNSSIETLLWMSSNSDSMSATKSCTVTEAITVSTRTQAPLFVTGTSTISLTVPSEGLSSGSLGHFYYECMNIDTKDRYATVEYTIKTQSHPDPRIVEMKSPLDTNIVRRRIVAERIWEVLGIVLGSLVPILIGVLFGA